MLDFIVFIIFLDISTAFGNKEISPFNRTTPAASTVALFPIPIAIPQSAAASVGASLMPSPINAVTELFFLNLFKIFNLSSGIRSL